MPQDCVCRLIDVCPCSFQTVKNIFKIVWEYHKLLQAFLSILSTSKLQGIMGGFADPLFSAQVNIMYKRLSVGKQKQIYSSIARQNPHDLAKVFKDKAGPIKRYSILNKTKLAKRETPLIQLEQESC